MGEPIPRNPWRKHLAWQLALLERSWVFLAGAVACEVLWAVLLKRVGGLVLSWTSATMALAYVLSLVCLNVACRRLDLSLAYAVWTGSGATAVALIGVLVFHEPLGLARALGFLLVISGLIVLLGFERSAG